MATDIERFGMLQTWRRLFGIRVSAATLHEDTGATSGRGHFAGVVQLAILILVRFTAAMFTFVARVFEAGGDIID